ncbi:MAG: hypothetical protein LUO85_02555 [Methanomassiliicoccales archaeon]|nr:hypothetical protein [Methanomassiliicoccales archaeon]
MEANRVGEGSHAGLTVGFVLIAAAVAILVGWATGNWFYLVPIFLLELGIFVLVLGTLSKTSQDRQGRSWMMYMFLWGGVMVMFGALLLLDSFFPGNVPVLIAVFLIFAGAIAILAYFARSRR